MSKSNLTMEELIGLIKQWNANRVELFSLKGPNENGEFWGVIRFCFQDAGQKVATKCVRVSNAATTSDVIPVLIEKFRADIRMLSVPEYGLYEIHPNGEERKLSDDEHPLMVQLNWAKDDLEGRFLLRRMDDKISTGSAKRTTDSKKEKKDKARKDKSPKSKENESANTDNLAEKLYKELPDSCFTRSISNPEAVMRRRRKQKLEQKLQQLSREGGPDSGGTLRIYCECLNKDVPYKTLLLSSKETAAFVVEQILDKYRDIDKNLRESSNKEVEPASNYCLVQVIEPINTAEGVNNEQNCVREYILDDDDCPLFIKKQHNPSKETLSFHIRKRPADYYQRKRKKKPVQVKEMDSGYNLANNNVIRQMSDTSSTSNNVIPDSYHYESDTIRGGMDPILPAILELWEEGENAFLGKIISQLDPERVLFKLAPTYTLYMAIRYRASTHFKKISPEERAQRLTVFVDKAANILQWTIQEKQNNLEAVAFWLANSSELLHFLKQDRHLSHYTLHAQESLAESVQDAYAILVRSSVEGLYMAIASFLENPDKEGDEFNQSTEILHVLNGTMALLRRYRVNIALTIQLFSRLFHTINFWLFNELVSGDEKSLNYCTEHRASVLKSRLATIDEWAHKNGLELAAQCYLGRIEQALNLVIFNRRILSNPGPFPQDFFKLNSLQVRRLLEKFKPAPSEPPLAAEVINAIVSMAEEKLDGIAKVEQRDIKLEEDNDIRLPFLLPDDGYTCDIIRGLPAGLEEFIYDLVQANLCRFTIQPTSSGHWTIYLSKQRSPAFNQPLQPPPQISQNTINQAQRATPMPAQPINYNTINQHPRMPISSQMQLNHNIINNQPPRVPLISQPSPQVNMNMINQPQVPSTPQPQVPLHYLQDNGYRIYGNLQGVVRLPKYTSEPVLAIPPQLPMSPPSPYSNAPAHAIIKLQKRNGGLGLSIVAARSQRNDKLGIYIKSVVRNGAADLDGRLQPGDQLLSVDGKSLIDVPQEVAAKLMTQTDNIVTLEVAKQAAHFHGLAAFLSDSPTPHIQRAVKMMPLPPLQQQLHYRLATMTPNHTLPSANSLKVYQHPGLMDDSAMLRMSQMSNLSASNQSFSQNSLKKSACPPAVSYRYGRSGYPGYPPQEPPTAQPIMNENNNLDKKEPISKPQMINPMMEQIPQQGHLKSSAESPKVSPISVQQAQPPLPSQIPQPSHLQPQSQNQSPKSNQQNITKPLSPPPLAQPISSNNIEKKVTWNGTMTITGTPLVPASASFQVMTSSSSYEMSNSNDDSEPYSPQEDHSFTLKDISEALEMDDEQDPNNSKGGYTPNVIGAQEVYRDPRERIKAEKMKNQPQKNIPGPEKLSLKEKMRLFEEESNSQQKS